MPTNKSAAWIAPVFLASFATLATGLTGCSRREIPHRPGIDPAPEALASASAAESFGVKENTLPLDQAGPLGTLDRYSLTLKKNALGKEFLLHGSAIPQKGAPTSSGLQARVVTFHRVQDKVFLIEGSQGHVVTHELPSTLILAEIPILGETADALTLDFNRGMSRALVMDNWHGSDMTPAGTSATEPVVKVLHSFIQSAEVRADEVEIRQITQIDASNPIASMVQGIEFRYFISPYRPNPSFTIRESSDFQQVGYFEVGPKTESVTGRTLRHISRWDDSKPIIYHVSANTPPEYVEAIREGILYWNKAFGREIVRAEIAPKGVTAPDPRYNIVQWVENDSAGSAYADALIDPRTGEIKHAQVYLTSVFAVKNKGRLPGVLRRLKEQHNHQGVSPSFLKSSRLCDRQEGEAVAQAFEKLVAEGATDEALLRATRDYLVEVTAHEIGHTLGLRHNFAGSLAANVTDTARDEMFLNYLLKDEVPKGAIFTSSVMEYSGLPESILTAAQARESTEALTYDKLAIDWGYKGKIIDPSSAPLFCTDSHADKYRDCVRFDSGTSPIESQFEKIGMNLKLLPISFVENAIRTKTAPDHRDRIPLERIKLDVGEFVTPFTTSLADISAWYHTTGVPSIRSERLFPYASDFNQQEILNKQREWVNRETFRLGGIDAVLFSILPSIDDRGISLAQELSRNLNAYLSREHVLRGTGYDGRPYELSPEEVEFIRETGEKVFAKAEEKIIDNALEILASEKFAMDVAGEALEARIGSLAIAVLLAQDEKVIPGPQAPGPKVASNNGRGFWAGLMGAVSRSRAADAQQPAEPVIRQFKYSLETRVNAVKLLARSLGEPHDWSAASRVEAMKRMKGVITASLGGEPDKTDLSKLSRSQKQWLSEQLDLVRLISIMESQ